VGYRVVRTRDTERASRLRDDDDELEEVSVSLRMVARDDADDDATTPTTTPTFGVGGYR